MKFWVRRFLLIRFQEHHHQESAMQKESISGVLPRLKPRFGVLPGRIERDRTKYTRKSKHKERTT